MTARCKSQVERGGLLNLKLLGLCVGTIVGWITGQIPVQGIYKWWVEDRKEAT